MIMAIDIGGLLQTAAWLAAAFALAAPFAYASDDDASRPRPDALLGFGRRLVARAVGRRRNSSV